MASERLVTEQFQFLGIEVKDEVLAKCVSLCEEYGVDAETLTEQWMAFSLNHLNGAAPTLDNLEIFSRKEFSKRTNHPNTLSKEAARPSTGSCLTVYGAPVSAQSENDVLSNYMTTTPKLCINFKGTIERKIEDYFQEIILLPALNACKSRYSVLTHPVTRSTLIECLYDTLRKMTEKKHLKRVKVEAEAAPVHSELCPATYSPSVNHSAKYASRTAQLSVVHSYGDEKLLEKLLIPNGPNDILNLDITQVPNDDGDLHTKSMFGFELLHEKASIFDNHIRYTSQCIMKKAAIKETTSVRHKTHAEVYVAGRIECDADARLNPKSVVLQGTWEESLSQAVPVDMDNVKQYSLFPGQVVVMRGVNPRGDKFVAHEVYCDATQPVPDHNADMINAFKGTMSLLVAAGPYTTSENLAYEPLKDLVAYITSYKPHAVIMTGPFLDCDHVKVKDNSMAETYRAFFEKLVDSLADLSNTSPYTKIYIVSSLKDAFHVNIYPTPAYTTRRKHANISFVPDPCTLKINGFFMGVTSTDVLMFLSQEEISLGNVGDKLSRLAGHLLCQQSYFPLWPPPPSHPTDAALWAAHTQLPCTPHIMIVPSNFRYFVKEVNGCVVVNPEHLTKGTNGGTFARLLISTEDQQRNIAAQIVRI